MDKETVSKLNRLNKSFYKATAKEFSKSRTYFWPGWSRFLPFIKGLNEPVNILDVGCGNGRFGQFLKVNDIPIMYTGLDSDPYLLNKARSNLPEGEFIKADVLKYDLCSLNKQFDLVVFFGLLHHIPGYENRRCVLSNGEKVLTEKGLLIFNSWHFTDSKSLMKRRKNFEEIGISSHKVEENDYLLDWGRGISALRYCHFLPDEEVFRLLEETSLHLVNSFRSTSKGDQYNKYFIASL